ncbi:hypothetical protein ACQ4PT_044229 [Festuca glaucescens]
MEVEEDGPPFWPKITATSTVAACCARRRSAPGRRSVDPPTIASPGSSSSSPPPRWLERGESKASPPRSREPQKSFIEGVGGALSPETVHEIRHLVEIHRPILLFLLETKMHATRAQDLKWRLGFDNSFGVSSDGLSGGLVLFWNNGVTMQLKSFFQSHIDVMVNYDETRDLVWRFTGFYGCAKRELRKDCWKWLRFLRCQFDTPWLCAGDFNEILCASEQIGGNNRE